MNSSKTHNIKNNYHMVEKDSSSGR